MKIISKNTKMSFNGIKLFGLIITTKRALEKADIKTDIEITN